MTRLSGLSLGGVDWNKLHSFMLYVLYGTLWSSCSEVVDFASFGRQAHCRGRLRSGFDPGLQTGAKAMVAGVHRKEEIGLEVVGADPSTVESDSGDQAADVKRRVLPHRVGENVDECPARFWRPHWVLMFIGRYLELDFVGSAASSHARCRCLILRKNWR